MRVKALAHKFIRLFDTVLGIAFLAFLMLFLSLAVYMSLHSYQIVSDAASDTYLAYKPTEEDELSFQELKQINPDVISWITIENTGIDYPIVQGKNNQEYVNTSVFGDFSLSGAVFLDSRNRSDFSDALSIVYGHNMTGDAMFGSIDDYEDLKYFQSHLTGSLFCNGQYYKLKVFAYFHADSHDIEVYNVRPKLGQMDNWFALLKERAIHTTPQLPEDGPILLLSTCASGETNGRRLLAASIEKGGEAPKASSTPSTKKRMPVSTDSDESGYRSTVFWFAVSVTILLIFTLLINKRKRARRRNERAGRKTE